MKKNILVTALLIITAWILLPACGSNTENNPGLQAPAENTATEAAAATETTAPADTAAQAETPAKGKEADDDDDDDDDKRK
ncbi:MAG: hypothetical protein L6Q97_09555 [Thermoanaerobaculia bacterium]|nr:hypothetical protein [Thermoanaerobaculia bacterium]